jgi:hypothetical protein
VILGKAQALGRAFPPASSIPYEIVGKQEVRESLLTLGSR